METTFPISKDIHGLPLGEVFQYILSMEWGISPELPTKDNVHYEKPKTGKDESEK